MGTPGTDIDAAYQELTDGPTIEARLAGFPAQVTATWDTGGDQRVGATFDGHGTGITAATLFASPDRFQGSTPTSRELFVDAHGLPAAIDAAVDLAARTATWIASGPTDSVRFAARHLVGPGWIIDATVESVPATWDALFATGHLRFRGLSGPNRHPRCHRHQHRHRHPARHQPPRPRGVHRNCRHPRRLGPAHQHQLRRVVHRRRRHPTGD